MISKILRKVFGSRNDRLLRRMRGVVNQINRLEPEIKALSDDELRAKTDEFRARIEKGESLEKLLPEAFAVVREASVRSLGMRHFDVQLIGGIVLHSGKIAEMRTGEGKTLAGTLPVYLNALSGKGAHVITVNDYLANRDAEWMRPIYNLLGLTVGVNLSDMTFAEKQEAYAADITYGTNNEFGFDYLRDNMAFSLPDRVQRDLNYAIVDEVDSILIDEARTPLIISGPAEEHSELYRKINLLVPNLTKQAPFVEGEEEPPGDYSLDEKSRQVHLTEEGHEHIEKLMAEAGLIEEGTSLYDSSNISLMHHLNAGLRAYTLFQRDVDYIVKDNQVVIVDEHTGRLMAGRRWSDGLHQAVEAKENVPIQNENQTLATITFQNYFRLYNKLSGMTGTADTEAYEFQQIYGLEVVVIPTNEPIVRADSADEIYLTQLDKFKAIVEDIKDCRKREQPVLVGTASVEVSEYVADLLKKANVPHEVLNAKHHESEAKIIAEAGQPGAVTIATNMAGRGTDIVLGGDVESQIHELENTTDDQITKIKADWQIQHDKVITAGGLHVLGTERHESRRIDNQLRGRSGRQGDPGSSSFYLSLEDNLMRIFASERVSNIMKKLGMKEGDAIAHPMVTRAIENAQRKVEGRNFDIRKNLLEFDDVASDQRKVIYQQRYELMSSDDISGTIDEIRKDIIDDLITEYIPTESLEEQWDVVNLEKQLTREFGLHMPLQQWLDQEETLHEETLRERIHNEMQLRSDQKEAQIGEENMRQLEKGVMLQSLDTHWKEHLAAMDHLRQGIHLRGYAQKNPTQEYKRESFNLFTSLLDNIKREVIATIATIQIQADPEQATTFAMPHPQVSTDQMQFQHAQANSTLHPGEAEQQAEGEEQAVHTFVRDQPKVGRNEPCPCGSGKKYKQCHGKLS